MAMDVFMRAARCLYSNSCFPSRRKQTFSDQFGPYTGRAALPLQRRGRVLRNCFALSFGCASMRDCVAAAGCIGNVWGGRLEMGTGHWMQGVSVIGFALLLCAGGAQAQEEPRLHLMPWPASLQTGSGSLRIDSSFSIALSGHTEARLDRAVQRFLRQLSRETALPLSGRAASKAMLTVHTDHASKEVQELGEDESYTLEISSDGAKIDAP